ncbi:MAG: endonuclease/exonuclease/phosphatase family protein [bacterium]
MRILLPVLWIGMVSQCHPAQHRAPPTLKHRSDQLKVVTFNVNFGGVDMARSARVILATNADVVALQETTPSWERELRRRLGSRYPIMRFRHGRGAGGMAFLSRWPLQTVAVFQPPARGWFPAWLVKVRSNNGQVYLLNVHLRPPIGDSGKLSSVPAAYFYTRSIRLRELQLYVGRVPNRYPLIVLGDFNEAAGPAIRWIRGRGMRSALAKVDRKTPTWRWKTSLYTFRSRLDHIFFSKHFRCVDAQVLGDAASDHYPVEAVLAPSSLPTRR